MERERFRRIQELFIAALDRPAEERASFLDDACGGDSAVRVAVGRYLKADAEEFSLLDVIPDGLRESPEGVTLSEGQMIGAYRVEGLIGRGGMGVVYKAVDQKLNRAVALKFLPPHLGTDETAKERFMHEAQAAAALDHPNVGTIYEIAETEAGGLYIAMAYYEGETLQERIARGRVPAEEAFKIALQIAQGLEAAHRSDVVHRDIKPANLILTAEGLVKIVDFGIAKLAGHDQTQAGGLVGTLAYMSPEQAAGRAVDQRADLWSLGIVVYEMISGRRPFESSYLEALRYAILYEPPAPLTEASDAMRHVVDKLLAKDPEARYASAADVVADLQPHTSPRAAAARPSDGLPDNLPVALTSFVGRDRELMQVGELLENVRLVTLTGTGGAGKTRLALQLASAVRERFEHGVGFISLESIRDPNLVASTIAQKLGVREMGGVPVQERLVAFLGYKRALLVLDNFEAVVEAGPLLARLLAMCPGLKMVVTSRVPLRISGEHEFPVPSLRLPDAGTSVGALSQIESVALFVQRAQAVRPSFALVSDNASTVVEICRRLDGLPLAIELAAARIKMLSPSAIRARLQHRLDLLTGGARDLPPRHRTLREAIAWSYDLLTKEEKKLFRRLSVFVGGCSLESVASVCRTAGSLGIEVLDGMASLVDKNLVRQEEQPDGEPRFFLMETIREFSQECLIASGEEAATRSAYRDFFLELAERAAPFLTGREQAVWLGRLASEHANLRAAMEWTLNADQNVQAAARFGAALWRFWLVHGHLDEGNEQLGRVLDEAGADVSLSLRSRLLTGAGTLAHNRGRYRAARTFYEQSLELHRAEDDVQGIAQALNNLGWTAWRLADYDAAQSLSEESLHLHRAHDDRYGEALSLNNLGWVAQYRGEFPRAEAYFNDVLQIQRARNDKRGVAFAQNCLGYTAAAQGAYTRAVELLESALALFRDVGDLQLTAFTLGRLGHVVHGQGEPDRATVLLERESLPMFRTIGDTWGVAYACASLGRVAVDRQELDRAEALFQESHMLRVETEDLFGVAEALAGLGEVYRRRGQHDQSTARFNESLMLRLEIGDKRGAVECLEGLAFLAYHRRDGRRSAVLLSGSDVLLSSMGGVRASGQQTLFDEISASLRADLGDAAFSRAWEDGRGMTYQAAAAYGLGLDDAI